jgi:putative transposase
VTPARRRARGLDAEDVSDRRGCQLAGFSQTARYRKSTARDQSALRLSLRGLAMARARFGYNRVRMVGF